MLTQGQLLEGRYKILTPLGEGGFGTVYLAEDTRFTGNNRVAVKEIISGTEQEAAAIRREADLLYNLHHPVLPKVSNWFAESSTYYLVMEYVPGEDLYRHLRQGRIFTAAEVCHIADQALDALQYLHSFPIFHRDIKPHNLKVDHAGRVFLLDFGTAKGKLNEETVTQRGQSVIAYTPLYSPLEQTLRANVPAYLHLSHINPARYEDFARRKTDARSDIFSLGVTLYQLLTNCGPEALMATTRAGAVWAGRPDPLPLLRQLNPALPPSLAGAIHRALELPPEQRWQTAEEFRRAIQPVVVAAPLPITAPALPLAALPLTVLPATIPPPLSSPLPQMPSPSPPPTTPLPNKLLWVALGLLLLITTMGGLLWWRLRSSGLPGVNGAAYTLSYSLRVQKMRDGHKFQEPFAASGQEIFENGYQYQVSLVPPGDGYLYLFNEGLDEKGVKSFYLLFPTPARNNGAAFVNSQQAVTTGWNQFAGQPGIESIWLVWAREQPAPAESARADAFGDESGAVTDPTRERELGEFLQAQATSAATTGKDNSRQTTKVEFTGNALVYLMRLEHR